MPKKEPVQIVNQATSSVMDLRQITNNVSGAGNAGSDLSGNVLMLKNVTSLPGFNFGFKKAIRSGDFLSFPDTAHLKLNKSKIIGSINLQSAILTLPQSNMPFTTVLISEKVTALSPS